MRGHQPGSQPIDIPESIPNPAIPRPSAPPSRPHEPLQVPEPLMPEEKVPAGEQSTGFASWQHVVRH
jgi:hypothetical protein